MLGDVVRELRAMADAIEPEAGFCCYMRDDEDRAWADGRWEAAAILRNRANELPQIDGELRVALTQLRQAVDIEGRSPNYHRAQKARLREEWPTLVRAIEAVLAAGGDPLLRPWSRDAR